jgi:hypothetical protein
MPHLSHTLAFGLADRTHGTKSALPGRWSLLWHVLTVWRRPSSAVVHRRLQAYI